MSAFENVRLVIWDLDDTFWSGTLEEGGCAPIERNIEIVRQLNRRGIINSICSKNIHQRVCVELTQMGVLDEFVLIRVAFAPKGAIVQSIIESAQLRPESVMFLDDNPTNLREVKHYNPGIQASGPDLLPDLLTDPRFKGKEDAALTRLSHYKLLERKEVERLHFAHDAHEFLRQSEIQLSFHYNVMDEFDRIHELVNRSNQLNFTKVRLPEDPTDARRMLQQELSARDCHAAYIKVADKYGDYGICGFYQTKPGVIRQFVFSCRIMDMGVEQFVFRRLGNMKIKVLGEVASDHRSPAAVDWIRVVPDVGRETSSNFNSGMTICVRGACELDQTAHYLRHFKVLKEFTFPYRGWGIAQPLVQFAEVFEEEQNSRNREVFERLPGLQRRCLNSAVFTGAADAYVLSFSLEPAWGNYKFKPTGMVVPLRFQDGTVDIEAEITSLSFDDLKQKTKVDVAEADWGWFRDNFEYVSHFDPERFARNLDKILSRLAGKIVVIIQLNTKFGKQRGKLEVNRKINEAVAAIATRHEVSLIELDRLILADGEALSAYHFEREVYLRLADEIGRIVSRKDCGKPSEGKSVQSAFRRAG